MRGISQEINDCTIDCYVNLAFRKFPITAATQAEVDEMALNLEGARKEVRMVETF